MSDHQPNRDAEFCRNINKYWEKKGIKANARTERRTYALDHDYDDRGNRLPLRKPKFVTVDTIVSDIGDRK